LAIIGIAERRGVLSAAARRDNGYREYTDDDLCQLR
jgi:DNA-binding transcriptional MerR regulator